VCRIRQVRVRLTVTPEDVRRARVAELWADAFDRALRAAMAAGGSDVVTAESRAAWIADFIIRLLDGDSVDGWAYEEFAPVAPLATGEAVVTVIEDNAAAATDVMVALDVRQHLGRMLAALDASQSARVLGVLDRGDPASSRALGLDDLMAVAALVLEAARIPPGLDAWARGGAVLETRAIRLFATQRRLGGVSDRPYLSASRIRDALRTIEWLCALRIALGPDGSLPTIAAALVRLMRGATTAIDARLMSPPVAPGDVSAAALEAARTFGALLDRVHAEVPSFGTDAVRQLAGRWIESDLASILLLVPAVLRLEWPQRIRASRSWATYGPRALTYALAGAALALAGHPPVLTDVDRGLLLFAGWTGEPDVGGFRHWLDAASIDDRRDLLEALLGRDGAVAVSGEWASTFQALAHALTRRFAENLRGFRRSSDRFVIERFLSTSGRVLLEPERLVASLDPNPLWVAVHLAGADSPVGAVSWLGDRRVEFELGGL
jgi:hypothetical protein